MYSRLRYLKKVVAIQDIVLEYNGRGITNEWLFNNIIGPQFYISRSTFYDYLALNARKELKELEKKIKELENEKV